MSPITSQRKLILTVALLLSALGLFSWRTMERQEDPRLPEYFGQVIVTFPGAEAEMVERLVLDPIEDRLAQVEEIHKIESWARPEIAVIEVELRNDLGRDETDPAWDRVRLALVDARTDLPDGASEPRLDDRVQDQESIVYALTGDPDPLALADAAETLEDALLGVPGVSRVMRIADPGEQVTIELGEREARSLGISPEGLAAQLSRRNRIMPGGSVEVAGRQVRLRPQSEFAGVGEIRATPILLPSGATVPLAAVARVRQGPEEPARSVMRVDGRPAVGLGVVPRRGINLVRWGEAVRARVAQVAPTLSSDERPIDVREMVYQPARVEARLTGLGRSLMTGALVVAGILVLTMGLRMGLVVASIVPLVTLSSIALFDLGGGTLHQMSIAAVVIALGMLVDNAIVMADGVQWELDGGLPPAEAAAKAIRELAVPLAGATATTLAAFLPMLLSDGLTAEFTRAIPVVIMLTLTVSYVFAVLVTPVVAQSALRPRRERSRESALARWAGRAAGFAVERPVRSLLVIGLLLAVSFAGMPRVRKDFFPTSNRNQLVVELKLPEGSHLRASDAASRKLERALLENPRVTRVAGFVGRSTPHFYYNLPQIPWSPHLAQIMVETDSLASVDPVAAWVRRRAARELPGVEVVVRKLEQGPPVVAPVELRLYGDDFGALRKGAEALMAELRATPGTADTRNDLSPGSPMLRFTVDDAAAARRGLAREDVARALYGTTRGLPVGALRTGDDPVPVVVRAGAGESYPLTELASLEVSGARGRAGTGSEAVPLEQIAALDPVWRPGEIRHRQRRRVVSVFAQLQPGATYADVMKRLTPRLDRLDRLGLPPGVELEIGGAAESSGEANGAMAATVPAGLLVLLGVLVGEFRSFRRVALVLVTVPLAAAGIVPGLLLGDQPFGFMSLLGLMALAGVVVNNAIVLIEAIEDRRREGMAVADSVRDALRRRTRPILLTAATTVLGLTPLALSESTLWPPLAWTMISGLAASTLLTLQAVPALYMLLFGRERPTQSRGPARPAGKKLAGATAAMALALALLVPGPSFGQSGHTVPTSQAGRTTPPAVTLAEAVQQAARRPAVAASRSRARAAEEATRAERRATYWPVLGVGGEVRERDQAQELVTPIGSFSFGDARTSAASVRLTQPLLTPSRQLYGLPASRAESRAADLLARRAAPEAAAGAAEAWLDVAATDAVAAATRSYLDSLDARLEQIEVRVAEGRVLSADALKVRLARDDARRDLATLAARRRVATLALGRSIGLDGPAEPAGPASSGSDGSSGSAVALATTLDGSPDAAAGPEEGPVGVGSLERALRDRSDLAAAAERLRAVELRRREVWAETLPRLDAEALWTWSDGSPYRDDTWLEAAVRVTWNPFAAGTRAPRAAALAAERSAREADLAEARRGVALEVASAQADLSSARDALEVARTGVLQAEETLRIERERYRAGRVTVNDLLEAEAARREQTTRRELAALDVVRARVRLALAEGRDRVLPREAIR